MKDLIQKIPSFNPNQGMNRYDWDLDEITNLSVTFEYDYDISRPIDEGGYIKPHLDVVNENVYNIMATLMVEGDEVEIDDTIYTLIEDTIKDRIL